MTKKLYEKCFSNKALRLAWERVNASVGSDSKDHFGISVFRTNLHERLAELGTKMDSRKYEPQRPFKYFVPKRSGTQRTLTVLNIEDAIIFQAIGNHIAEYMFEELQETKLSVFGSVLNSDVQKGENILDEEVDDYYFFEYYVNLYNRFLEGINDTLDSGKITHILETDITGFFDTIPHSSIILELNKRGIHSEILEIFAKCLNVWSGTRDSTTIGVGIPQGPATSFLIANIILDSMDRLAIKSGLNYYRFMDDIRIYGNSKQELLSCLVTLDRHLKAKSLCLNSKKTSIQLVEEHEIDKEKLLETYGCRSSKRRE
jgi:retron-type reverse transcriptase